MKKEILFTHTDIYESMHMCKKSLYLVTFGCDEKHGIFQYNTESEERSKKC